MSVSPTRSLSSTPWRSGRSSIGHWKNFKQPGYVSAGVQRAAVPSRPLALREDSDANVYRQCAASQGENIREVIRVRASRLSDEILTNTYE